MLYKAKWNVPKAAAYVGMSSEAIVAEFNSRIKVGKLPPQRWESPPMQLHIPGLI